MRRQHSLTSHLAVSAAALLTATTIVSAQSVLGRPNVPDAIRRGLRMQPQDPGLTLTTSGIGITVFSPNAWLMYRAADLSSLGKIVSPASFSAADRADIVRVFVCADSGQYQIRDVALFSEEPRGAVDGPDPAPATTMVYVRGCTARIAAAARLVTTSFPAARVRALIARRPVQFGIRLVVFHARSLFGALGGSQDKQVVIRPGDLASLP